MLSTKGEWQEYIKLALQYAQTAKKMHTKQKQNWRYFAFLRMTFHEMPNACKNIFWILKTDTHGSFFGC